MFCRILYCYMLLIKSCDSWIHSLKDFTLNETMVENHFEELLHLYPHVGLCGYF